MLVCYHNNDYIIEFSNLHKYLSNIYQLVKNKFFTFKILEIHHIEDD